MSKPHLAGYSETFPVGSTGHFQKIWYEVELEPGDDPRQELYKCKKIVNDFYYESNKAAEKQAKEVVLDEGGKAIAEIMLCTDIEKLKTYDPVASTSKAIRSAYNQKFNELSIKRTKKLP